MIRIENKKTVTSEKIGEGAFSEVFRIDLSEPVSIGRDTFKQIVIKKSKSGKLDIDETITKFTYLKEAQIKTLQYMEKIMWNNEMVLLVQDLNSSVETIYVSSNTKIISIQKQKMMRSLSNSVTGILPHVEEPFNSIAEDFRKNSLLNSIIDFKSTLRRYISEIYKCSCNGIELFTDAFFFSSSKTRADSKIDFIIADFDNIKILKEYKLSHLIVRNIIEALKSFYEFIFKYFIQSLEDRDYYLRYIEKISSKYEINFS